MAWAQPASAQYTTRFTSLTNGAITFTGNSLGLDGESSRNGQGTRGAIGTFITTDVTQRDLVPSSSPAPPFPFGTTSDWLLNSSQAQLRLPAGARVLHAELVWGGTFAGNTAADNVSAFINNPVVFTTPAGTFQVAPDPATARSEGTVAGNGTCSACYYVRSANVTALVVAGGPGAYTTGRVPATQGTTDNNSPTAGWTLAVAYEDFTRPIRNLSVFLGLEQSGGAAASVSGFCTPPSGPVSGRLAASAMEGDARITGDQMRFGRSTPLATADRVQGPRNPLTNFFSGQIVDDNGFLDTSGTFGDRNHTPDAPVNGGRQGWDITNVDVSARLQNNQTSAFAQGTTDGDAYRIIALALQIDVGAPKFASADAMSVDRATAQIGDVLTYTVLLDNTTGTTNANNVVFFNPPPAGMSFVANSFTVNGVVRAGANLVAGVPLGVVASGTTMTVRYQFRVDSIPAAPTPNLRTNKARWTFDFVSCAGQQAQPGANETNTVVTDVPTADLSVTKTVLDSPAIAGASVSYRIIVTNNGPSAVSGALVTDAGATPALTNINWTCNADITSSCTPASGSGTLSSLVSLPGPGATATFTIVGTLPANTPAGTLNNTAAVSAPITVPDFNIANNSASSSTPLARRADLDVTKTGPATGSRGGNVVYTIVVANRGPSDTESVLVSDPTPAGLTLVSLTGPCTVAPGCSLATGASHTVTATFAVPPDYAGPDPIVNVATATSAVVDPDGADNSGRASTSLNAPVADVSVTKTDNVTEVTAGLSTTYTMTVTNTGPAAAIGARVMDTFDPATFGGVQWQCVASGTSTCTTTGSQAGDIDTLVNVNPGAANAITFTVQAPVLAAAQGTAENTVTVATAAGVTDPTPANNSATDTDTISRVADVSVVKTGPPEIVKGTTIEYTITVGNAGPSAARDIDVAELPTDGTFFTAGPFIPELISAVLPPPGVTCRLDHFVDVIGPGIEFDAPMCTVALLPPQETRVITIRFTLPPDYQPVAIPEGITDKAEIFPRRGADLVDLNHDPNTANNASIITSTIAAQADVAVTKIGPPAVVAGSVASYFIRVSNNGSSTATNVVIDDPLPAGLTLIGGSGPCVTGFPCTIPELASGEGQTTRIDLLVPFQYAGPQTFVNTATVQSAVPDPTPSNNVASVSTLVVRQQADLAVTLTGPATISPGALVEIPLRVTNLGPGPAIDVTTSRLVPAAVTRIGGAPLPPQSVCASPPAPSNLVFCRVPLVPVGGVLDFTIRVQASTDLVPGMLLTFVAAVSSPTADFNSANDRAELVMRVASPGDADLLVEKTDTLDPAVAGSDMSYTIRVGNAGPATATNVVAADALPPGFTLVSATPSQGTCAGATCTLGTLAASASATITIVATAPPATGIFTNTVTVAATEPDPESANNTASQTTTVATPDQADLVVVKRGPTLLPPGASSFYTIVVTNRGPAVASNVQVLDTLPAGATFVGNSGACTTPFPCLFDTLAPGQSVEIATSFTVAAGLVTPAVLVNTVTVESPTTPDPVTGNNSATLSTNVQPASSTDLVLIKQDTHDAVIAGTTIAWALSVSNRGPADAVDVTLTDLLPPGVTPLSATATQGSCSVGSTVVCQVGTMPPGGIVQIGIVGMAPAAVPTPNPMINAASVTSATTDFDPSNDTSTAATTILPPVADLTITKIMLTPSAIPGLPASYSIVVTNRGPSGVAGAVVADPFPAAFGAVVWTCAASAGSSCGAASGAGHIATTVDLVKGGTATFVATGTIASGAVGTLLNSATAAVPPGTTDPDPANNTAVSSIALTSIADLQVSKTGPAQAAPETTLTYAITVTNAGPSDAVDVTLADPTPAGLSFVPGAGPCVSFPCALGTIPANGTVVLTATFAVPLGYATPDPIVNTATVSSPTPDPAAGNNTATAMSAITAPVTDLGITKSNGVSTVVPGGTTTYTITVTNAGPQTATGAVVRDAFPPAFTSVMWTCESASGGTCAASSGTGDIDTAVDIPAGGSVVFRATATVAPDAVGIVVNAASVTPGPGASDPSSANNTDQDTLTPEVDVSITKIGPVVAIAGQAVVYTISVTNHGPSNAANVVVTDPTPTGLQFVSNAGDCTTPFPCSLGTLTAGATRIITATFGLPTIIGIPLPITNVATASSTTNDIDPSNNSASVETGVNTNADVEVAKSIVPPTVLVGDTVTITVTARNNGPNVASGVEITDMLPGGLQFVSAAASTGAYDETTGKWDVGSLAVDASAQLVITATVTAPGSIANLAVKTGQNEPDPITANDSAVAATNAAPSADLAIEKTVDRANALVTQSVTFTVRVTNRGPSPATGVAVTDALPAGVTLETATASAGTFDPATGVWTIASLAVAGAAELTLTARIDAAGALTNNATISAQDQVDRNPLNGTAAASVNAAPNADLRIAKAVSNAAPAVGSEVTYTIAVTNLGPSVATSAEILDRLPAGLTFVSAAASQGTYDEATGIWTLGTIPVNGTETLSITALVAGLGALDNAAARQASAPIDPNPVNDSASAAATPALIADLAMTKTPNVPSVPVGGALTWTILVTNRGPSEAAAASVTDLFQPLFTGVSWSCTASTGSTCADPSGTGAIGTTVTLASGGTATFVASGTVSLAAEGFLTNSASVAAAAGTTDPNAANDTATSSVEVIPVTDASVTVTGPGSVVPGTTAVYTITVAAAGPSVAAAIVLTVPTPIGLTLSGVAGACTTVPCTLGGVAPGDSRVVTVTFAVPASYAGPIPIVVTATLTSSADPNPANDAATVTTDVTPVADLAIGKTGTAIVLHGRSVSYTLIVINAGPSDARDVVVNDPTPAGLTFVSTTGGCVTPFPCALGTLAAGARRTITATFGVPADYTAPVPIVNTATVAATTTDPAPSNNRAVAASQIQVDADVEVTKSAPSTVTVGETITVTVGALNHGPIAATGVAVTDRLPAGFAFVSATPTQGTYDPVSGVWSVGTLAADATAQLAIAATATEVGAITNLAVKTGQNEPDPITANDSAAAKTNVAAAADLAVSDFVDRATALVGDTAIFTVDVTNRGPSAATGLAIANALPPGFALTAATPSHGTFDAATGLWTIGALASGSSTTLTLVGTLSSAGVLVHNASVASQTEIDPNPVNDSSAASINAAALSDLQVTKAVSNQAPIVDSPVTFTIAVTNFGPSPAEAATLRDLLPAGLSFVSATASQGSYDPATGDWVVGALPATRTETLAITARVDQAAGVSNTASLVASAAVDPNPANDVASVALTPVTIADLAVTSTPGAATVAPGAVLTWTIAATNAGPGTVSGATVTATFPATLTGVTWICAATAGSECAISSGTRAISALVLVTLAAGGSATFTASGIVAPSATGTLELTASITVPSGVVDPVPANNAATSSVTVVVPPPLPQPPTTGVDVAIWQVLTRPRTPADPWAIAYSLWNLGPGPANNIQIEGDFPRSLILEALEPTAGGTCETTDVPGALHVRCVWPGVTPPRNRAAHFLRTRMRLAAGVPAGSVISWAMASRGTDLSDPDTDNDTLVSQIVADGSGVTDALSVTGAVESAGRTAWAMPVRIGDEAVARFVVTNRGYAVSRARYALRLNEPGAVEVVSAAPTQGTISVQPPNAAVWDVGEVAPGTSATLELRLRMHALTAARIEVTRLDVVQGSPTAVVLDGVGPAPSGGRWVAAANLDGVAGDEIVTGTGMSDSPQVGVFSAGGQPLAGPVDVFDRGGLGGVRVASCDVDGDGRAEVIAAQGPGGSRVRILRLVSGTLADMSEVMPFEASFAGGVSVACADLDGDGRGEVIVGAGAGRAPEVRVYTFTSDSPILLASYLAFDAAFTGGVRVAAARTSTSDALIVTLSGPGRPLEAVQWQLTAGDVHELARAVALWPEVSGGAVATLGDADGDGQLELLVAPDTGEPGLVRVYALPSLALLLEAPSGAAGLSSARLAVAEVPGGARDIIVADGPGGWPRIQGFRWSPGLLPNRLKEFLALEIPPGPPQ